MAEQKAAVIRLLEKTQNIDKDLRYMGISDLMIALEEGKFSLSCEMSNKVCKQLLIMIEDRSSEVANMVVKSMGSLERHVTANDMQVILRSSSEYIRSAMGLAKSEMYASVLREIVIHADPMRTEIGQFMLNDVLPFLLAVLKNPPRLTSVHLDVMEIIGEITRRFGRYVVPLHEPLEAYLIHYVNKPDGVGRKRAIIALGHLLTVCSVKIHGGIVDKLVKSVSEEKDSTVLRSKVSAVILAAKGNPVAFSQQLEKVIPLILRILDETEDEELMEALLQNIEAFLSCCPRAIKKFIPTLQGVMLKALVYDPNYNCGEEDEEDANNEDEDSANSDYMYSDDDDGDLSWKARRSAARALHALITSQSAMAPLFVQSLGSVFITRLTEREDSVLCDILLAYTTLVRSIRRLYFSSGEISDAAVGVEKALRTQLKTVLKCTTRILSRKAPAVRIACFDLLSGFCKTFPNCLSGNMNVVFSALRIGLNNKDSSAQLKVTALGFFCAVIDSHRKEDFVDVGEMVKLLLSAVSDPLHKVLPDAVYVIHKFSDFLESGRDEQLIQSLLAAITEKLNSGKNGEEFRDRAISCMGHILSLFGSISKSEVSDGLGLLISHASPSHDGCRVAMLALVEVAKSSSKNILKSIAEQLVQLCCMHMKKGGRDAKVVAMDLLTAVVEGKSVEDGHSESIVETVALLHGFTKDSDSQLAQMALNCLSAIYVLLPQNAMSSWQATVDALATMVASPLIYGPTLNSLVNLARVLVTNSGEQKLPIEYILDKVTQPVYKEHSLHRQVASSIAMVTAEVVAAGQHLEKTRDLVKKLGDDHLKERYLSNSSRVYCILAIGEIGRLFREVYETGPTGFKVEKVLIGVLNSKHEDLRTAAAQAFGALAAGNPSRFLPVIVKEIQTSERHKCLLLNSIKEAICCAGWSPVLKEALPDIWKMLETFADCEEEGVRLLIAECLGRSSLIDHQFLPMLLAFVTDNRAFIRHCALSAFKYIVASPEPATDTFLNEATIEKLLSTVGDPDLLARRASLTVLNAIIHRRTSLVFNSLPRVLPMVFVNLKVREDLIREVEMGPFKHEVDEGVDVRKAAVQILYSLMEKCPHRVNVDAYIAFLRGGPPSCEGIKAKFSGIQDRYHDIRMLSYMMLAKLMEMFPAEVLCRVHLLADILRKHLDEKSKNNAVRQEVEKLGELKQTVIRFILNMHKLHGADKYQSLKDLHTYMYNQKPLAVHWPSEFQRPLA